MFILQVHAFDYHLGQVGVQRIVRACRTVVMAPHLHVQQNK